VNLTVFGSARLTPETDEYKDAVRLGQMLAAEGHTITTGGYGGLMEAASRGAHDAGGTVVGITMAPWKGRISANRYLSHEHAAQTLFARIEALIKADCLIALAGGAGTLGEVALAWNLLQMDLMPKTPVILVGPVWKAMTEAFRDHLIISNRDLELLKLVGTVDDVIVAVSKLPPPIPAATWRG